MYQVRLEVFEGPLDLLLHLVRKNEICILDIPIKKITSQYLEYLALIKEYDLNTTSEFLIMAAILVQMKSRILLPRPEPYIGEGIETDEEVEKGPKSELVRILLEYKEYREAAEFLKERAINQEKVYTRAKKNDGIGLIEANLFDLLCAFAKLVEKRQELVEEISADEINIHQRMEELLNLFEKIEEGSFESLFSKCKTKAELIATLLALLELVRLRRLCVRQEKPFSSIWIYRKVT